MDESPWPLSVAKKQRNPRRDAQPDRCHLASPRRRERKFPWQVFGLCRLIPTCRTSRSWSLQCHLGRSYLLTAAGQLRNFAGFPFHSPRGETMESLPYLGSNVRASPLLVDKSVNQFSNVLLVVNCLTV